MSNEDEIVAALDFGASRAVLENKGNSPLSQLLNALATDVTEQLKKALVDRDINTSSLGLSQSIKTIPMKIEGDTVFVGISAEFYWKFINYGVNGIKVHRGAPDWGSVPSGDKSFSQAIRDWIPQRGLQLPPEFSSFESFKYAIMGHIRNEGKEARPFFEDVVNDKLVETLREPIEKVIGRSIEISIASPWQ